MNVVFYISAIVAVVATALAITRLNAVHALLYLVLGLLSLALIFFSLGAPFVAALEVIIYAGAIVVLILFAVMLLNLGPQTTEQERRWQPTRMWFMPALLAAILVGEVVYIAISVPSQATGAAMVGPREVGLALFGPYVVGVQLASLLLLAGMIGAYHLGRKDEKERDGDEV
jgi:NADH-quinone oxidoreductase subunit J